MIKWICILMTVVMFGLKIAGVATMATVGWWTVFSPVIFLVLWITFWVVVGVVSLFVAAAK